MVPFGIRFPEQRAQRPSLEPRRWRDSSQRRERRVDVDQFDDPPGHTAGSRHARGRDHQRRAGRPLEQALFHPEPAVISQVIPVVAQEHDKGVLTQLQPVERVQQPSNLRVDEADRGVVGAYRVALPLVGDTFSATCSVRTARRPLTAGLPRPEIVEIMLGWWPDRIPLDENLGRRPPAPIRQGPGRRSGC